MSNRNDTVLVSVRMTADVKEQLIRIAQVDRVRAETASVSGWILMAAVEKFLRHPAAQNILAAVDAMFQDEKEATNAS